MGLFSIISPLLFISLLVLISPNSWAPVHLNTTQSAKDDGITCFLSVRSHKIEGNRCASMNNRFVCPGYAGLYVGE